jgi:hypothetical protein
LPYTVDADPYTTILVLEPSTNGRRVRIVDAASARPAGLVFEEHYPELLAIARTGELGPARLLEKGDLAVGSPTASRPRVERGGSVQSAGAVRVSLGLVTSFGGLYGFLRFAQRFLDQPAGEV